MDPKSNQGFLNKYKFTLISLGIIVLAAIPLLLLSNTGSKHAMQSQQTTSDFQNTGPLTGDNVQPTLTQLDTDMQATLNQADTDIQTASQVDTSRDQASGL